MKTSIPVILLALLACASAGATDSSAKSTGQARVIIKCSATGDCHRKPAPAAPSTAAPAPSTLAPERAGDVQIGMMSAPMMMAPPSLAAPAMPPTPMQTVSPASATIPAAAHAACAKRKAGSRMTVELGPKQTLHGACEKEGGRMRFRMRDS